MTSALFPFINESMTIRRCPYCKAIIDEKDKYCNNCGTQLLFPEDESIEEDIPGEKIIDKEHEEKESGEEEIELGEDEESGEDIADEPEEEKEKISPEDEEEIPADFRGEEEEEQESAEELGEEDFETGKREVKIIDREEFGPAVDEDGQRGETEEEIREETGAVIEEDSEEDEAGQDKELPAKGKELTFRTEDLEKVTRSVEERKKDVEEFFLSFEEERVRKERKKRKKKETIPSEELPSLTKMLGEKPSETEEELPPWAEKIKESPPSEITGLSEEEETVTAASEEILTPEEETPAKETRAPDSGIGIPEGVTQKTLPFRTTSEIKEARLTEIGEMEEFEEEAAGEREDVGTPSRIGLWFKAKIFDLMLITGLWLISLVFASRMMEISFFKLILNSALPLLIFYSILLIAYFFLFLFFIGETLGDRLFSPKQ